MIKWPDQLGDVSTLVHVDHPEHLPHVLLRDGATLGLEPRPPRLLDLVHDLLIVIIITHLILSLVLVDIPTENSFKLRTRSF